MAPMFRPNILEMGEYAPPLEGRSGGYGLHDFNERTTEPHPLVLQRIDDFVRSGKVRVYPEYGRMDAAVAGYAGVAPGQIICTNGSDQAIDVIFRGIAGNGDVAVVPSPSFAMFYQSAGVQGARILAPRYAGPELEYPYEEVYESLEQRPKLVLMCTPNNPTGRAVDKAKAEEIIKEAGRREIAVLIDEAYHEFNPKGTLIDLTAYPNVFVTRTASKALGIASLRAGYAASAPDNIAQLRKIRGPYDVNMAAAAALTSLELPEVRDDIARYAAEVMARSKPVVEEFYRRKGVRFYPSDANFHLVDFNGMPFSARDAYGFLRDERLLIRPRSDPPNTARISIGTMNDTDLFMDKFSKLLARYGQ
ncbi:MAG: histidinol-phosphate aminotransferase family protein [Candidatus Aenigmarchaeota archaeon]|nr:histidinol-phosphate aminotransferase family protein [Candidatus Aenigmarchaeota archaeon]